MLGFDHPADAFAPSPGFHLDVPDEPTGAAPPSIAPAPPPTPPPTPPPRFWDGKTTGITAGVLVVVPIVGYVRWWEKDPRSSFSFANERWFQRDTYAGGADKASHIFLGYISTQALQAAYGAAGKSPAESRALAFGVVALAGAFVEVGDGYSEYGFAWEDMAANTIGSLVATGIDAWGIHDTVGLRFGYVKALIPDACCRYGGYGDDYSKEIYSSTSSSRAFSPRVGQAGSRAVLLLSATYGSKGYRYSDEPLRQRNIGIEVSQLREILSPSACPRRGGGGRFSSGSPVFPVPKRRSGGTTT